MRAKASAGYSFKKKKKSIRLCFSMGSTPKRGHFKLGLWVFVRERREEGETVFDRGVGSVAPVL